VSLVWFSLRLLCAGEYILRHNPNLQTEKTRCALPFAAGFPAWSPTYVITGATDLVGSPPALSPSLAGFHRTDNPKAVDLVRINERWPQVTTRVDSEPRRTPCPTSRRPRALSKNTLPQHPVLLRCLHQSRHLFHHRQWLQSEHQSLRHLL